MKQLAPIPDDQFQALAGLIDAGVRATGIRSVHAAAKLVTWLESATDAFDFEREQARKAVAEPTPISAV